MIFALNIVLGHKLMIHSRVPSLNLNILESETTWISLWPEYILTRITQLFSLQHRHSIF